MRRTLIGSLVLALIAAGASGVQAAEKVVFGTGSAVSLTSAPITMAMGMGYFKEEGLEVELQPFRGGSGVLMPQLVNKSIPIGFPTLDVLIIARQPGRDYMPLRFFYNMTRTSIYEIVVPEASGIKQVSDLRGKKIGVGALTWGSIPILKALLKEDGLEAGKDVELIAVGQGAGAYHAFTSGQVDALDLFDVHHTELESLGTKIRRVPLKDKYVGLGSNSLIAHEDTLKSNPTMLASFGRAVAKATVACDANVAACVRMFWQQYPQMRPTQGSEEEKVSAAVRIVRSRLERMLAFPPGAKQSLGEFPAQMWREYVETLHAGGQTTTRDIAIDSLYTNGLVPEFNKFDRAAVVRAAQALK